MIMSVFVVDDGDFDDNNDDNAYCSSDRVANHSGGECLVDATVGL